MSRTKIVATLGPATRSAGAIEALLRAGADVLRLNFSHGEADWHRSAIQAIRRVAGRLKHNVAILGDLPGTKIRLGRIDPSPLLLEEGQPFFLTPKAIVGARAGATVQYRGLLRDVRRGDQVALADGAAILRVRSVGRERLDCLVEGPGAVSSNQGVNFPGVRLKVPSLTAADRRWIRFAVEQKLDFLALSFVRCAQDVRRARRAAREAGGDIPILAKIEKHEAVEDMAPIVEEADGAMAARGDLGVELPLEDTPPIQKRLIRLCNRAGKPVITATQMMESMVSSRRPTRAEVSDVANAILDGTDAVMLSAETAVGRYPAEAVAMMDRVARAAEPELKGVLWFAQPVECDRHSADEAIAHSAFEIAESIGASAIVCCTTSGATARRVARYRPRVPILAFSQSPETIRRLQLAWGVEAIGAWRRQRARSGAEDVEAVLAAAVEAAVRSGRVRRGEKIVATAGAPLHLAGNTNLIRVIDV